MAVAFDAIGGGANYSGISSVSWSHTASGADRLIAIMAGWSPYTATLTSVTYDGSSSGVALGNDHSHSSPEQACAIYYKVAPATTAKTVALTFSGGVYGYANSVSFTGVDQSTPVRSGSPADAQQNAGGGGASNTPSITVTSPADDMAIAVLKIYNDNTSNTIFAPTSPASEAFEGHDGSFGERCVGLYRAGDASPVSVGGTLSGGSVNFGWVMCGLSLQAAGGGEDPNEGELAATDAADTLSAAGTSSIAGAAAVTDAADTLSAAGTSSIAGALAATDAADTLSATGASANTGALAATDAADTLSAAGSSSIAGSAAPTDAADTLAAAGTLLIAGALAATDAADTLTATGTGENTGTLAATDAADTLSATAVLTITGAAAPTDAADTLTASGTLPIAGALNATDADDTLFSEPAGAPLPPRGSMSYSGIRFNPAPRLRVRPEDLSAPKQPTVDDDRDLIDLAEMLAPLL